MGSTIILILYPERWLSAGNIYLLHTRGLRLVLLQDKRLLLDQIGFTLVKMGYYKNLLASKC
ncbi:Uncharacterised protein [Streptococcus pneumoniae]|nr:Uncharacterised protein [Streptococcus pneumoniae]VMR46364.1 Uncharacterised protein [Streptococcus pneumoniae]